MPGPDGGMERRLRVAIVGLNYAPETTGIAPYTTGLARHLALAQHDVTVVTGHPHYPEWEVHAGFGSPRAPEWDHGVCVERVGHPVPKNPHGAARVLMEAVFAARAGVRLARRRPALVICVSPALLALVPALLLRPIRHHRVGVIVQDLYGAALAETGLGGGAVARLTAWLELVLLQRVDGITVIHDVFRKRLIAAGIPAERIDVVPNWSHVTMPADTDRALTRRALGWSCDDFVALHAGNMGAKQGLEGLVDVAKLAAKRGSAVRVVLLGNGSRRAALMEYAKSAASISFVDSLPAGQFEDALTAADALLLHEKPGVVEMSVPSKLTTYFTAGRPVVAATDPRSGAAAMMALSRGGVTVRAGDASALLDALEWLAANPKTASTLGANGQYYAAEHLTGSRSLALLENWVQQGLSSDGRGATGSAEVTASDVPSTTGPG